MTFHDVFSIITSDMKNIVNFIRNYIRSCKIEMRKAKIVQIKAEIAYLTAEVDSWNKIFKSLETVYQGDFENAVKKVSQLAKLKYLLSEMEKNN